VKPPKASLSSAELSACVWAQLVILRIRTASEIYLQWQRRRVTITSFVTDQARQTCKEPPDLASLLVDYCRLNERDRAKIDGAIEKKAVQLAGAL
jgi:hypothetical protein